MLSHAAIIIPVSDIENARSFYRDILHFEVTFCWEEPPSYMVLKRESISIHLTLQPGHVPSKFPIAYFFSDDIESLYQELEKSGCQFTEEINVTDYAMKEFVILDPDHNKLIFGKGI